MNLETVRLFASGPFVVLCLIGCLGCTAIVSGFSGRLPRLTRLIDRASLRLESRRRRGFSILWGVSAMLMLLVVGGALMSVKSIALLGVLVSGTALVLGGIGTAAAALALGRGFGDGLDGDDGVSASPTARLVLGLATLLAAVFVPFAGWLLGSVGVAAGVGAVLDVLFARRHEG